MIVHGLVAVGVHADGHREILGFDVATGEDGAGCLAFFRGLLVRGLTGVRLVTSDAHPGLVAAIQATLPGATWRLSHPLPARPADQGVQELPAMGGNAGRKRLPAAAEHLAGVRDELLAFTGCPREIRRQVIVRLAGAVLLEQNDEWTECRRYFGLDVLAETDAMTDGTNNDAETEVRAIEAISA